ncbi:MAG: hypothetical protein ACI3ZN_08770 [Candidatus Cryptobacteroides sp.]
MVYKIIAEFFHVLTPICICVVLPVLIVWLTGKVKQNETNRRAEIMLKALDKGVKIDTDFFRIKSEGKSIKERLLSRLTGACMSSLIGLVFIAFGIFLSIKFDWQSVSEGVILSNLLAYLIGGILIAVGISLFIAFASGRNLLEKEIEAEEKQLTENK